MKIKLGADLMHKYKLHIKLAGKIFDVKKKKTVTRTLGYYFDYKGKTLFVPKNCATEINGKEIMTDFEKLQIKARDAIYFLSEHPAISPMFDVFQALAFSINPVCKRSYLESAKSGITIRLSSKYAKRFKKEFDEEIKEAKYTEEELKTQRSLISIEVPYKKLFGEDWKFDHVEYWADIVFYQFKGKKDEYIDQRKWQTFQAIRSIPASRTFEEMIVKVATQFKKLYGDFNCEDFLTKREIQNHKKEMPMITVSKITSSGNTISNLISNPKYIKVTFGEINQRWYKWFQTTDYYKKNF